MITSAQASGGQVAQFIVLVIVASLAILGDGYTTAIGLSHGFKEVNPIMKYAFSKLGQAFTLFLSGVLVLFLAGWFSTKSLYGAFAFLGIIAVGEGTQTYLNYKKLKAAKISLK